VGTFEQALAERARLQAKYRCIVRYAPPSHQGATHRLLVRDKRRRRDNEASEHEIANEDHAPRMTVTAYWAFDPAPGWSRNLVNSGLARRAANIPALWGAYEQHVDEEFNVVPKTDAIFDRPRGGGDHVS